jgi:tRNA (guanosine-2'-O-)-methyltransferase
LQVHLYDDPIATIKALQARGYRVYAAEVTEGATPLSHLRDIPDRWVVILGNEEEGVPPEVVAACDEAIVIEMEPEIKSFNVAMAGAIVMHWMSAHV